MARGRSRVARAEEMRALLERWQQSDMPLSRFADRAGVAQKTLYRWRRRLGVGGKFVRRGRPPMFTEVGAALCRPSSSAVQFEVVLGDGTIVRVPDRFDPDALRLLLETLRRC